MLLSAFTSWSSLQRKATAYKRLLWLQVTTGGGLEAGAFTTPEWSACGMSLAQKGGCKTLADVHSCEGECNES